MKLSSKKLLIFVFFFNRHFQQTFSEKKTVFRVGVIGNFDISELFECLVKQEKCSSHHTRGISFSPLPDVTVCVLLTNFVQGTALNHWRWWCMEDNKCGRHVLDHCSWCVICR